MTEFEPWISSTRSDRSTNWATTRVTSYFSDMIKNNSIPEFAKFLIYLETFGQICGSQTYGEKGLMEQGSREASIMYAVAMEKLTYLEGDISPNLPKCQMNLKMVLRYLTHLF